MSIARIWPKCDVYREKWAQMEQNWCGGVLKLGVALNLIRGIFGSSMKSAEQLLGIPWLFWGGASQSAMWKLPWDSVGGAGKHDLWMGRLVQCGVYMVCVHVYIYIFTCGVHIHDVYMVYILYVWCTYGIYGVHMVCMVYIWYIWWIYLGKL